MRLRGRDGTGLTFVLDHAGKPPIASGDLTAWTAAIREFAAFPNTVCKLSGLITEAAPGAERREFAPVAEVILTPFGPDRVMFGSDWPVCLLATDYPGVVGLTQALVAGLSRAERTAVFSATAARAYRIRDDAAVRAVASRDRTPTGTVLAPSIACQMPGQMLSRMACDPWTEPLLLRQDDVAVALPVLRVTSKDHLELRVLGRQRDRQGHRAIGTGRALRDHNPLPVDAGPALQGDCFGGHGLAV